MSTTDALNFVVSSLLYIAVFGISRRHLLPRLSPRFRQFALLALALQILVRALAVAVQPTSAYEEWLWDSTGVSEWNIASQLDTTQLALVVGVALLAAWLASKEPVWKRLHLVLIGAVAAFLLADEHFKLHEAMKEIINAHIALGLILAAATFAAAKRSDNSERIWRHFLLAGLALSAFGAVIVDRQYYFCRDFGIYSSCPSLAHIEETLELAGIWIALVAALGLFQSAVPKSSPNMRRIIYFMPAIWALLIIVFALFPRLEFRLAAESAAVDFESGIRLAGYTLEVGGDEIRLRLFAEATLADYIGIGYSVHLVDQASGDSIANQDKWASRRQSLWYFGPDYAPLYRQALEVAFPQQAPTNRALWVVLTLWRKKWDGSFPNLQVISSDRQLLSDTQVVLGELVLPESARPLLGVRLAKFDNGFSLDAARLPASIGSGETLEITFGWRADEPGREDLAQFLHLGHVGSGEWQVFDQHPLGARLPTRLWYNGLTESETWRVPLPADIAPGEYRVLTGLYRLSDKERLPVRDVNGAPFLDMRAPIGSLKIEGA